MKLWVAVLGISLCAQTAFDTAKERALGEGEAKELLRGAQPLREASVNLYLQGLCERLTKKAGAAIRVEVVLAAEFREPLGLVGGIVIIPATALLDSADEAELAGLTAHAIGHALHPRGAATPASAGLPRVYWRPHSDVLPPGLIAQNRQLELEIDLFGARLAQDAGFDAGGLERYIRRTQAPTATGTFPFPPRDERLAALEAFSHSTGQTASSGFLEAKERLRTLVRLAAPVPTLRR